MSAIADPAPRRLPLWEFIGLIAMTFAMVAFSIDAMLPALPEIGQEISPHNLNRAQLVLTSFVLGMGLGTFFTGPLSDTFGRKPVIFAGVVVYLAGAALASRAESMEMMIAARILQGLGVAGPRIVAIAIVRDLYEGRQMASIMSYAMMIFTLVPAVAPLVGAGIIALAGWRAVFVACIVFALLNVSWLMIRQPETLPHHARRPLEVGALWQASRTCATSRPFVLSTLCQSLSFGILFATLSSTQQIFAVTFERAESFPLWFAMIALLSGTASIINARVVQRFGMRRMIAIGFVGEAILSAGAVVVTLSIGLPFPLYILWTTSIFFMAGLVIGNLNALAMEPLGHIAGLAASVIGSVATIIGALLAIPIGLMFSGTPLPLALGVFVLAACATWIVVIGLKSEV